MSTERILVQAKIADDFRAALTGTIAQIFGDANGMVMIDGAPVERNSKLVQDAVSKGAKGKSFPSLLRTTTPPY